MIVNLLPRLTLDYFLHLKRISCLPVCYFNLRHVFVILITSLSLTAIYSCSFCLFNSFGLGCFIYELFSGTKLGKQDELRNTVSIPKVNLLLFI